ncbi:hypothetical protein [Salinispora cortesiana]|uniref:hypothetical protein n=1 Tax=Salinispora cortesiana TaxID=1305843 RepID=UPI0003F74A23|nr:hypothetical protein [Salinispora cortesiana]
MRGTRTVVATAATLAVVLGGTYLLLPPMGSDLAAQVARADFFAAHGATPVDLRWYGGVNQFGYSLLSQPVMALLGVRVTGVLALVASTVAFAALLCRVDAPRPLTGALVGAVTFAGNLVAGRVTYGLGVAFGLTALLALTLPAGRRRLVLATAGALLAAAASPVAGLFVGLAGAALLLGRRYVDGLALGLAAALPLGLTALLFGDGGWMNISRTDTVRAVGSSLLVAALVAYRPVRIGALLATAGVLAAALLHTPVGLNATRLSAMFALPLLAAAATIGDGRWLPRHTGEGTGRSARPVPASGTGLRRRRVSGGLTLAVLLAAVFWWQPPVVPADLRSATDPATRPAYFAPLRDFLATQQLIGRVEIPPTRAYRESAALGEVPLARGWLRQADIDRNPLFFTTVPGATGTGVPLTAHTYHSWLRANAVQFVAVPDAPLSWVGRAEAELVRGGLPYLREVWSDPHWRVWAVVEPTPLVGAPGTILRADGATVTFQTNGPATVPVRVRYSRWLTATGGTVTAAGEWTAVAVPRAGVWTLGS